LALPPAKSRIRSDGIEGEGMASLSLSRPHDMSAADEAVGASLLSAGATAVTNAGSFVGSKAHVLV
jgi:hypothetical protein